MDLMIMARLFVGVRISFDAITLPSAGRDQLVSEFFADAEDVNIHEIRQGVIAFVEEMFVEHRAGHHFTPV
jgi:hypothetical protein